MRSIILDNKGTELGIDVGSTTVKVVLIRDGEILFSDYRRHYSKVRETTLETVRALSAYLKPQDQVHTVISGSAGMGIAAVCEIPFVQEVFATGKVVKRLEKDTDVVIELGGEDAKMIFFDEGGMDEKMNGSCAGGTGAFIDQMAVLLNVTTDQLDEMSLRATQIYPIASRCGVFAKTDVQPLINQGAKKEDIAASVYQAVVNQTIAGLAQGRKIEGKVVFLGGALYYCKGLRRRFSETLGLDEVHAVTPEYARVSVALGAALKAADCPEITFETLCARLEKAIGQDGPDTAERPLFETQEDYDAFAARHAAHNVRFCGTEGYTGDAYLGIDCGSTTTKLVLLDQDKNILYSYYDANNGNPVSVVKEQLEKIYDLCAERITLRSAAVTGYGEELITSAFGVDYGLVETLAHFAAARHFNPQVDFIIDIGGQDMKCFKIKDGAIDSIMLNEACSSGCGSFIETFATAMGYNVAEFAKLGLFARHPVDLGSRCTVFMNSSVKQAQRDGATVGDISAGLSMSVVKNALYKVIRTTAANRLGEQIVVQGGTFLNDAILRAFETELGREVIRPNIAGLMGAYGCALYALKHAKEHSGLLTKAELAHFEHRSRPMVCKGCANHCNITVNTFSGGRRFVSGNKCSRGSGEKQTGAELPDLYRFKYEYITSFKGKKGGPRIGLPMALGMYELAPFWHALFTEMGFETVFSDLSNRALYFKGQYTIPSDTVCYPAKLMHGHVQSLLDKGVDLIFYPSLTYNVKEPDTDNYYNCPVVAYYGELLNKNMETLQAGTFLFPYLNINDPRQLTRGLYRIFGPRGTDKKTIRLAVQKAYRALALYREAIHREGLAALDFAKREHKTALILAGRPYHIDPEINHSINKLAGSLGLVVLSEDAVSDLAPAVEVDVLNQWTYHARLYKAAQFAAEHENVQLVQLVSFGCGLDAITTDEVRSILRRNGKLYTQIKMDEITNLGAVKIRLRSLIGALEERGQA